VAIMARVQLGKSLTDVQTASIVEFLNALTGTIDPEALVVPLVPSGR